MYIKILKHIKIEIFSWSYFFFYLLPGYHFSNKLRGYFIRLFLKKCGKDFLVNREVIIEVPENISIGNHVGINTRCWISGGGTIEIENHVLIGPNVTIVTANHNFIDITKPIKEQGHTTNKVILRKNTWIGAGTIILPGVEIGSNTVVGAGSVVTKSLDAQSVYAGNPAKKIRER